MKDIYIADLANFDEGKLFDGFFIVLAKQQRTPRTTSLPQPESWRQDRPARRPRLGARRPAHRQGL